MIDGYSYLGDLYYTIVGQNILATVTRTLSMLYFPWPLGQCNNKKDCFSLGSHYCWAKYTNNSDKVINVVLDWALMVIQEQKDLYLLIVT
jgi:hypothetical protein